MHKARAFFYVCAGVFLLALSYHLGARSAAAQAPSFMECVTVDAPYGAWAVIGRQLYNVTGGPLFVSGPIPGTRPIVACGTSNVVLDNGEVWEWSGGVWNLKGAFPGGPVP